MRSVAVVSLTGLSDADVSLLVASVAVVSLTGNTETGVASASGEDLLSARRGIETLVNWDGLGDGSRKRGRRENIVMEIFFVR